MNDVPHESKSEDEAAADTPDAPAKPAESWIETAETVYALGIALVIRTFLFQPFNIPSGSMEGTLLIGDYLFVEKFSYGYSRYSFPFGLGPFSGRILAAQPQRGDVIVFKMPNQQSPDYLKDYIKRVIGMPGDRIQVINGVVYLNEHAIPKVRVQDYIDTDSGTPQHVPQYRETLPGGKSYLVLDAIADSNEDDTEVFVVPPGHYFMMGDNRDNSDDSRLDVGYVPYENLEGKALFRFFSTDGNFWEFWKWRFDRMFTPESTDLEARLGHTFKDRELLKRALTHASANAILSNERLEFLGDRVLGLVAAEQLHAVYPDDNEGALALKFNALARRDACTRAAEAAGLAGHIVLANSETGSGGRSKSAILSGTCEAVIAALYLDGGMEAARRFIECYWAEAFAALNADMRDAKTALQEWAQARRGNSGAPVYRLVRREGPDHAPRFVVEVSVNGEAPQTGEGGSKREAEQDAAKKMLDMVMVK